MELLFDSIRPFFQSFATILMFMIILPLFIQLFYRMIINSIEGATKTKITPIVDLVLFPGAFIRRLFLYLVLRARKWSAHMGMVESVGTNAPTNASRYRRGFFVSMRPPRSGVDMWDIIAILFGSYLGWGMTIVWMIFEFPVMTYMTMMWGLGTAKIVYTYVLITMALGAVPIPEETLLPLFYLRSYYPDVLVGCIVAFLGSSGLALLHGKEWGDFSFNLFFMLAIIKVALTNKKMPHPFKGFTDESLEGVEII